MRRSKPPKNLREISKSIPTNNAGCPTSRWFFARCGIPRILTFVPIERQSLAVLALWYPTSREKPARYGAPSLCCGRLKKPLLRPTQKYKRSTPAGENLHQLLRWNHLKLRVRAIARLLICAPPAKLGHVTEAGALHMLVSDFDHQFGSKRFPRQVFPLAPATLTAGHALFTCAKLRPAAPRVIHQRISPIRQEEFRQLTALLCRETCTYTYVL